MLLFLYSLTLHCIDYNKIEDFRAMTAVSSKAGSEPEKNSSKKEKFSPPTKVVIRRLPPSMTKEEFEDQVSPIPDHDYLRFVKADPTLDRDAFCTAYINFLDQEDVYIFQERFDGYVFVDNKGSISHFCKSKETSTIKLMFRQRVYFHC